MGSIVFVIIIVVVSIAMSVGKQNQKKQKSADTAARPSSSDHKSDRSTSYSDPSLKRTSANHTARSYSAGGRTGGTAGSSMKNRANVAGSSTAAERDAERRAAELARENMTEQELKSRPTDQEFRKMAGVESDDGAILSAAKMHSLAAELGNEFDSREDLMKPVFDLMVTGPDTSIPNARDFIAEGTDMINAYTLDA